MSLLTRSYLAHTSETYTGGTTMSVQYIDYATKMMNDTLSKYHKYGYTFFLDWEKYEYKHPRYDVPIQMILPQVVVEFPH